MIHDVSLRSKSPRLRHLTTALTTFYADRRARHTLVTVALLLCYGGGTVMFGVHYTIRRECGPPINAGWHWLLDSTIGFVALTPLLIVGLPAMAAVLRRGGARGWSSAVGIYSVLVGSAFAVATAPGPYVHDRLAGQGRPLARLATSIFGEDATAMAHNMHGLQHSMISEGLVQVTVGLPVYIALTWLALRLAQVSSGALDRRRVLAMRQSPTVYDLPLPAEPAVLVP